MSSHSVRAWSVFASCVALAACAPMENVKRVDCATGQYDGMSTRELFPATPRLDCGLGDAVGMAIARQTLDRNAGARNAGKDAAGMDGSAARDAVYNYQKSFRTPEPAPSGFTTGVGAMQ